MLAAGTTTGHLDTEIEVEAVYTFSLPANDRERIIKAHHDAALWVDSVDRVQMPRSEGSVSRGVRLPLADEQADNYNDR